MYSALTCLLCLLHLVDSSLFDPHLFPKSGPYFEGWYLRAIDHDAGLSFAVLFGQVLPNDPAVALIPVYVGLLYTDGETNRLQVYDALPTEDDVKVTVCKGQPVTSDPGVDGPAWFRWSAGGTGYVEVHPDGATINVTVEGVHLEATIGPPHPWNTAHTGPQGWLRLLPFISVNWFVYSTHSPLLSYSISFPHKFTPSSATPGRHGLQGRGGQIHMEKNWGKGFPEAWVWTQGMREDNVTYAMGYGPVGLGPITLPGHLGGYRNPKLNLSLDFRPDNSFMVVTQDECRADILLSLYTLHYKLLLHVFASIKSFSQCIYGPTENGFSEVALESYTATAEVLVFERNFLTFTEIDSQTIYNSALEFGGSYTCDQKCDGT